MVSAVFVNRCVYFLMIILLFPCTVFAENSPYKLSLAKDVTLISVGAAFNVTNYFIADYHSTLKQRIRQTNPIFTNQRNYAYLPGKMRL